MGLIKLDVSNYKKICSILDKEKPDVVIHTAAITDVDYCDDHEYEAWNVNTNGCFNLALACKKRNIKLISISTDYVFDGKKNPYKEDSEGSPLSFYGHSKLLGDKAILAVNKDAAIIRITILYGYNDEHDKPTVVTSTLKKLLNNKRVLIDDNRIKYPLLIDDVALNIKYLIEKNASGIFNFSTNEPKTRYQWSVTIANIFGLDKSLIREVKPRKIHNRPFNVKLINIRYKNLKFRSLKEGLELIKKQMGEKCK